MLPSAIGFKQLPKCSLGVIMVRQHGTGELTILLCVSHSLIYDLQAFTELLLSFPKCPCATQDPIPGDDHNMDIWVVQTGRHVGKIAAACPCKFEGCNMWSKWCLQCLFSTVNTPFVVIQLASLISTSAIPTSLHAHMLGGQSGILDQVSYEFLLLHMVWHSTLFKES